MVIYVVTAQFLGALLVFLVVPIALVPFLEQRFEVKLPRRVRKLEDHLIIFHYGPAVSTLLSDFEKSGVKALVVEEDVATARNLLEQGHVVLAVRDSAHALDGGSSGLGQGVIANGTDDRERRRDRRCPPGRLRGRVLALVEEPVHRRPMMLAGATAVFTPRHVLGAALAARASDLIGSDGRRHSAARAQS